MEDAVLDEFLWPHPGDKPAVHVEINEQGKDTIHIRVGEPDAPRPDVKDTLMALENLIPAAPGLPDAPQVSDLPGMTGPVIAGITAAATGALMTTGDTAGAAISQATAGITGALADAPAVLDTVVSGAADRVADRLEAVGARVDGVVTRVDGVTDRVEDRVAALADRVTDISGRARRPARR